MMGKVECPIRLYGVQNKEAQGGVGGKGGVHLMKLLIWLTVDHTFLAMRT